MIVKKKIELLFRYTYECSVILTKLSNKFKDIFKQIFKNDSSSFKINY